MRQRFRLMTSSNIYYLLEVRLVSMLLSLDCLNAESLLVSRADAGARASMVSSTYLCASCFPACIQTSRRPSSALIDTCDLRADAAALAMILI